MNFLTGCAEAFGMRGQVRNGMFRIASVLALIVGAVWSLPAAAFSATCDLQAQSATPVSTTPSTSVGVTYSVVDQGNCAAAGGMPYTITISGDTTGGAVLDPPTLATGVKLPGPHGFSVTPGPSVGSFSVTIQCTSFCSTTGSLTWVVNATGTPGMSVTKVLTSSVDNDGSGSVTPGDQLNYSVTADNTGNTPLTNVFVSDDHFPGTNTCSPVPISGSCVLTGSYIVIDADASAGSVTNIGSATSNEVPGPVTDSVNTPVSPNVFSLTTNPPTSVTLLPGQNAALSATYLRNGVDANSTTIWSDSPASGSFSQVNPVSTNGSTGLVINGYTPFTPGVYTITVNGNPSECGSSCPAPISYTVTAEDLVLTHDTPPSGAITISQNSSTLLKVEYAGPTLQAADGTQIQWTMVSEPAVGAGTFTAEDFGPPSQKQTTTTGGFTEVTFNVTIPGTYVVQAGYCPDGCDDTITFTITVPPDNGDVSITKTDTPDPVAPGAQLTYTITVANAGPGAATGLSWTDTLPAEVTFASLTKPGTWSCTTPAVGSGGTVTCNRPGMPQSTNAVFTLVVDVLNSVSDGDTISNTATITTSSPDSNPGNGTATTTTTVVASASPALTVDKQLTSTDDNDDSSSVSQGDQLNYTVTATNSGNTPLTNVVVSDDHFPGTTTCPTLGVGLTCVLTGSYTVTAGDVTTGSVTNIGSATSNEVPGPITDSEVTSVSNFQPATLAVGSGNGQSTPVNTPFPQPLTVIASGAPPIPSIAAFAVTPGVTINWQVMSGSASVTAPTSVTNASGVASMTVTAGPTPGPIVVRARRNDDPSAEAFFNLTATAASSSLASLPGLTPAQQAVAEALDAFCEPSSGGGGGGEYPIAPSAATLDANSDDLQERCQEMISAIGTDPEGVIEALDQLFADIALVQSEAGLLAAQAQFDNIKVRIAALRSGTRGTSFGGLALNTSSGQLPIGTMFQSLLAQDPGDAKEVGKDFSRWGFFAAGSLGRGNADPGVDSPGYDFDINGFTVGADYRYSDKLIFGATLGFTKQTNDLAGSEGNLDTRGWSVSAFGTLYQANSWYSDAVLTYGKNNYDAERRVHYSITLPGGGTTTIDQLGRSDSSGDMLSLAASFGRDFNKGGWGFGPYFRAIYTRLNFDPLEEEFTTGVPGSGLALAMHTRNVTSVSTTLGGKLTYAHSASWGVMMPHLQLEWQHEFKSDPSEVEAHFLFDPTATAFTIAGDPVDTDFFRFGVGMSFVMTKGRSGFFYYERLISRERFTQNSLAFGLRLEF